VLLDLATRTERELVTSPEAALFPVAFSPAGDSLYYVRVHEAGSDLFALDLTSGAGEEIALLATGLTRDWSLAPAGDRLAFLELSVEAGAFSSRAYVYDFATGLRQPVQATAGDEFSPIWSADGALAIGRSDTATTGAGALRTHGRETLALAGPARGFDVPLAWSSASGGLAVRSFEGVSAMTPGRSALMVVQPDGRRTTIATGEVTFLGWID
jgi:hypothetical protein